jgi:hypothetical protein
LWPALLRARIEARSPHTHIVCYCLLGGNCVEFFAKLPARKPRGYVALMTDVSVRRSSP